MRCMVLLLGAAILSSCSVPSPLIESYRQEAKNYCRAHSIDYWEEIGQIADLNGLNPTAKQVRLIQGIESTVVSEKMNDIIYGQAEPLPAEEFYPYLRREIPNLTQEPFDCPAIEEFYVAE